jgi:hypothetical protein
VFPISTTRLGDAGLGKPPCGVKTGCAVGGGIGTGLRIPPKKPVIPATPHPGTPENPIGVEMKAELAEKANGGEPTDPIRLPSCASEIVGANFMASLRMFNLTF